MEKQSGPDISFLTVSALSNASIMYACLDCLPVYTKYSTYKFERNVDKARSAASIDRNLERGRDWWIAAITGQNSAQRRHIR